ncbi:MAG TPA: exodeoxyribonuclease V subunit gamma, partial [Rhodanobacter sp.]|nr:exodeoxyribonuclease V subunit gamma [Rhodanobacter sp.]
RQLFATPATPAQWAARLRGLLAAMFDAGRDDDDALALQRLDDALADWEQACAEAGFHGALPLAVVREHWLAAIDESRLSQRFLGGAVSFGTLLPMRAIPFRVVCLLGMNDGGYPRRHDAPDFDLMALPRQQRPGDRSRREDDRYLFLEALLSARDALYVSWVGRSARDNAELPPSVLVGQLRDYLAAGWRCAGGDAHDPEAAQKLLAALTTDYPLQAFSQRYFDAGADARLFTYGHEWQRAREAAPGADDAPLPPWQPEATLNLGLLQRFLRSPAKTFYAERLGVRFDELDDAGEEHEPFALDGLERHGATDSLLRTAIAAGIDALAPAAQRLREQGGLPPGSFGTLALEPIEQAARDAGGAWHELDARWPRPAGIRELRHEAHGLCIEDWLGDLRDDGKDGHVRLIPTASALTNGKAVRHDKLLDAWVAHLLANANALRLSSWIVGPDATLVLPPLDPAQAAEHLDELCAALRAGMQSPLPIARKTAFAWLQVAAANQKAADDKQKDPAYAARQSYDHVEHQHGRGEVGDDVCLEREWPDFDALHRAGFEDWLHLYRPLLIAARKDEDAA